MNDVGFRLYATDDVSGPAGRARSSLLSLGGSASSVSGGLGKIGSGAAIAAKNLALIAVPAALALGSVAISSTNAARQFQANMVLIQTQAGASAQEVTNMSAAILKLAPQTGVGPEELAAGLYHVESAGLRGAKALEVLTAAAEGAQVGHADLESVTNALIAANQSGVKGVEDMAGAMGTLNAIVGAGNMRMQDLTDAMGTGVLSTAKNYGVSLQSVGAALASMTDQGIPAIDAATRINSAMRLMAAPTSTAAKELKSIGLSQFALAEDMRGPGGIDTAIHDLKDHLDKSGLSLIQQSALIAKAFGGKQSGAILTLIGNVDLLDSKVQAVNQGAAGFGAAMAAEGATVQQQQDIFSASVSALKIQLGTELLPVEQRVLTGLNALFASPAVQQGVVDLGKGINDMFSADNIGGAEKFIADVIPAIEDFGKTALPPLIAGLKVAGQITKTAFDMFNQLPEPLKAAIIGGLAVNKLSGGLIGSGVMDIMKVGLGAATGGGGVGGGVGGLLGVQKVFVTNMGAGGMGAGAAGAASTAGGASMMSVAVRSIIPVAIAAGSIYALAETWKGVQQQVGEAQTTTNGQIADWKAAPTTTNDNTAALAAEVKTYRDNTGDLFHSFILNNAANTQMGDALTAAADKLAAGTTITPEGIQALRDAVATGKDMLGNSTNVSREKDTAVLAQLEADLKTALTKTVVTPAQAARDAAAAAEAIAATSHDNIGTDAWRQSTAAQTAAAEALKAQAISNAAVYSHWTQPTPPAPTVNVTVNTSVTAHDITTQQSKRVWYGKMVPE